MDTDDVKFCGKVFGIFLLVMIGLIFAAITFDYFAEKNACETWAKESERETKFVSNYPWYFDCLTKTESGWISAHNLYQQETPNLKK